MTSIIEQDRQIEEALAQQSQRLRSFIRSRVPSGADVEDLVQDVLYEFVRAYRLLTPIDTVGAWLFRVARNRITDLFRKKTPVLFSDLAERSEDDDLLEFEDMLSSPEPGPEAQSMRVDLVDALQSALDELPSEQRAVFIAHELEGRSFKEISAETGVAVNTLLSRKRYAVLAMRKRLQSLHQQFPQN
jgi:RNA polymerase sigma factor (sigma-70 family)